MHGSRGEARLRSAFLVAQVGFAVLLTIVSATLASSLVRLQSVDLGYRPDSTFLARLSLPPTKAQSVEMLARFAEQLEGALRATPGVVSAGAISVAPLSGQLAAVPFSISGRPPAQTGERLEANYRAVTPGYFAAVRARVRRGRAFTAADDGNAEHVIAISRALEERFFEGQDALGKVLMLNDNNAGPRPVTIVGILEDMRHIDVAGAAPFDIYFPMAQLNRDWLGFVSGSQFWAVRVAGGANFSDQFARVLGSVDRDAALARVQPMRSFVAAHLAPRRVSAAVLLSFAFVAFALATIGAYGVVAYSVAQRRREVGLRLALGATPVAVMRAFVQPAGLLALGGVALGVCGALITRRLVAGLLFGIEPTEPLVLLTVGGAVLLTSLAAAAIPARRAAAVDPAIALTGD